ncbi:MAG: PAS domain-containing protein, partial [Planctomycetes bacterium]|nr:PAS domain-containing protein [Planctomycetota bacterium]
MFLARRLILVLIVLTALGGSAAYFTTEMGLTGSSDQARHLGWAVFALMSTLSIVLVILIWQSLSQTFRRIRQQLRQLETEDKIGMIMIDEKDELADLVADINHYLTQVKTHVQENRFQQKEFEMQARVSEAERRQTEAVIFSISEAVFVTDKFDRIMMANHAAQNLFAFNLNQNERPPIDDVISHRELLELIQVTRQQKNRNATRLLEWSDPQKGKKLSLKV